VLNFHGFDGLQFSEAGGAGYGGDLKNGSVRAADAMSMIEH
jgi:hypothetical protein